jgi:chromosome partitioning protein
MIITVGGIKGGTGKTTIATTIAVMLSKMGRDVLLVDADDQGTATDFTNYREATLGQSGYTAVSLSGPAVMQEINKLAPKFRDVVIDAGGRDTKSQRSAMATSDIYITAFAPRSFEIWTLEPVVDLIGECMAVNPNLRAFALLNRTDAQGKDNEETKKLIQAMEGIEYLDTPIGNRKAFASAASIGLVVSELKPFDNKAIQEVEHFMNTILSLESK